MLKKMCLLILLIVQHSNHCCIAKNFTKKTKFQYFVSQMLHNSLDEINSERFTIKSKLLKNDIKSTALMKAAFFGYNSIIKQLLATNITNIDKKDHSNGNTALMFAVINNRKSTVAILLEYGANPNITNNSNQTALDIAKSQHSNRICNILSLYN